MNIYVGNLPFTISEDELREAFEAFGTVDSVAIIKDKDTGQSRGFAFVEMSDSREAKSAIDGLNGKELKKRALVVNEARPRTERRDFGSGGGNRGGGSGGSGGDRRPRSGGSSGGKRY